MRLNDPAHTITVSWDVVASVDHMDSNLIVQSFYLLIAWVIYTNVVFIKTIGDDIPIRTAALFS